MRPDSSRSDTYVSCFKSKARAQIESNHFTIIANIGDQFSDLVGGHAERTFKVPDPLYFIDGGTDSDLGCAHANSDP